MQRKQTALTLIMFGAVLWITGFLIARDDYVSSGRKDYECSDGVVQAVMPFWKALYARG